MVCSFSGAVPPEVTIDGTSEQFTIIGNEIRLTCHYNSSPAASEVQWQKNGRLISRNATMENGARGNITHFNESSIQLTISQSVSADAANYTCLVINSLDNSSDTVVMVVKVEPDPPHVRIISTTSRTLAISWTAGFNGNSEITSYTVKISEDNQTFSDVNCQGLSNSSCVVSGISTNATLEGLHPATMYYLKVFAINSIGQSDASSVVNATTDEEVPNAPPANVTGRNTSSTSILVQWDQVPVADRNGVILTYTVAFMALPDGSEQTHNVTAPTTNATLMSLNKYTNYSITVFASTSKGGGNKSAPIIVTTDEDRPNAPPANVSGRNENSTSILVQWNQVPAADKNGVILSYTVTFKELPNGSQQTRNVNAPTTTATLTGLNEYTNYSITVFASTSKGGGNKSAPIVVRTDEDTPTASPSEVRLQNKSSTSIFVSWGEVPEEEKNGVILSYTVYYVVLEDNTPVGSPKSEVVPVPSRNVTLRNLNEDTEYQIKVAASTSKGLGVKSEGRTITTDQDKPNAPPEGLREFNTSSTSIVVQWDQVPPADQNGVILSYTVTYRALSDMLEKTENVPASTRAATLTGLSEYTNYSITVFASTIKGGGNVSVPIIVRTDEDKPNAPPANVTGYNTSSISLFVQWDEVPAADQNGVILRYTVTYTELPNGPEQTQNVTAPTTNAQLTSLNEYTNYSITVFASTIKGDGNVSAPIIVITDEDKPSAPPANVTGYNTSSSKLFVQWDEVPADEQNGVILTYTVSYTELPNGRKQTQHVTAPTTQAALTGLNEYTNYSITVFASTIKGDGNASEPIIVITDEDRPNAPPANVTGRNVSSRSIFVQWNEVPAADQNGVILSYTVTFMALPNGSQQTHNVTAPTTTATLTGLNEYTNYSITVFASTIKGGGNKSAPIIVITDEDRPNAPPANVTGYNTSSTTLLVQWDEVPADEQNGVILTYTVNYTELQNGRKQTQHVTAPITNASLTGLNEYSNYSITVFASTIKGDGIASEPIIVITDEDRPNAPPANVTGRSTGSTIIFVEWDEVPVADQNGVILGYTVSYKALSDVRELTQNVTDTEATLRDLNEYTNYSITVFASTIKGGGIVSQPLIILTDQDIPSAPPNELQAVDTTSTSILVQWGDVPDSDKNGIITSYTVRYQAITERIENAPVNTTTVEPAAMHANLTDLIINVKYNISVLASTVKGDGPYSNGIEVTTNQSAPGAPPSNVRGHNTSSTTILVQWDEVPIERQHGEIISYTVIYWRTKDARKRQEEKHVQELEATLQGLEKYTDYNVEVLASTIRGRGPHSHLITVRTDQDTPSASPAITHVMALNSTSILVEWDRVPEEYRNGIITQYTIHYKDVAKKNESTVDTPAPASEITITALRQKALYSIRIRAATSKGDGPWSSATETETPPKGEKIPIDVNVNVTEEQDVTLNCTTSKEAPSPKWSRKDGEAVETQSRVLKDDETKLRITSASVRDAGIFYCESDHDNIKYIFNVSVKVLVKVEMVIKVLNYQYTPQLQNKSSKIFIETAENFTAEMDIVYKNTPGYVRTEVLNFTKGSVKVDFRVIIIIVATDPKNESTITDKKAETGQRIIRKAKTGSVERLKVSPDVEVKAPPPDPRDVEIFDLKSDELSVRWIPPEDLKAFNVYEYKVQHRRFQMKDVSTNDIPASEGRDKYSYRIQNLEPETTYMISVAAVNKYGSNFNEESGHQTLEPPLAIWIILLIVLGVIFLIAIIIGGIVCFRRRAAERRKRQAEKRALEGFGNPKELDSVLRYEEKNVKGLKFSFVNDSYKPSDVNWTEIPYENINLMDELGSGAFGVVYRGEIIQEKDDVTPCAVKTVKASASHEEIRDLYNELEIMTNVGYHPNLVNLLGACTKDGNLLVVLEIAENGSLLDFLKKSRNGNENYEGDGIKSGGLAEDMKLRIATDVAKGMAYLASHRCIHRDLAARNVLLGENYVAKVADYGMARDVYESLMYKKETQGKLPVKWMAIESLETYVFTVESDIWSYGVLLWEIESGGLKPYAGMTTQEIMTELKKGYRLEKPSGCSDAMYQVMRDCWNPNPKLRPSFEKLAERLEAMV